jgi:hypothetical protein
MALCAIAISLTRAQSPVQAIPASLRVTARNGDGRDEQNISRNGRVPLVLVRPNQAVPVTLQFPNEQAGFPVAAIPLDGGEVNGERLLILPTGKVLFVFKPGVTPGRYRLLVQTPVEQHLLEFYVVDPNNPIRRSRAGRN